MNTIRLQPIDATWLDIPELERKALLEFALRKFQFLVQGSHITIPYHKHSYPLRVLETKPATVISITDTDLQTELAPPDNVEVGQSCVSFCGFLDLISFALLCMEQRILSSRNHIVPDPSSQAATIHSISLEANQYYFFTTEISDPHETLTKQNVKHHVSIAYNKDIKKSQIDDCHDLRSSSSRCSCSAMISS